MAMTRSLVLERHQTLFLAGAEPANVFQLLVGCLRLEYPSEDGNVFHSLAVADMPYQATAVAAARENRILVMPRPVFLAQLDVQAFRALASRCLASERRMQDLALNSPKRRVAEALLNLAGNESKVTVTHAGFAGIQRKTATRWLGKWQRDGVLTSPGYGQIEILNRQALESIR